MSEQFCEECGCCPMLCDCHIGVLSPVFRLMVRVYNAGYAAGHHDTVEGQYTHIENDDLGTYHEYEVAEIIKENENG